MRRKLADLNKNNLLVLCIVATVFLLTLFVYFTKNLTQVTNSTEQVVVSVFFAILLFAAGLIFLFNKKIETKTLLFILLALVIAILCRIYLLDFVSKDYNNFLNGWVAALKNYPGISGWKEQIGDYNMPYMYLLTIVAKSNFVPVYGIKFVSIIFDFVLAYYVMKIVSIKTESIFKQIAAFIAVLFVPTLLINGACWAQCDVIYTAFAVASLYYGLKKRSKLSIVMAALGFSFKIQMIFFLPILLVFLFTKHIKVKDVILFPLVFITTLLPAIMAGKPIADTFSIYINQTQTYPYLTQNAASVYALIPGADQEIFKNAGILFALGILLVFLFYLYKRYEKIDTKAIIMIAALLVFLIPMTLPKMHERYFFMADIFSLILFVYNKKRWYIPAAIIFTSLRSYIPFLFDATTVNIEYLAILQTIILLLMIKDVIEYIENKKITKIVSKIC